MAVPPKTPERPGVIGNAQILVIFQAVALCCCGFLPIYMFYPAFLFVDMFYLPEFTGIEIVLLIVPLGVIAYVAVTNTLLGRGDRRGRSAVADGLLVLAALAVAAAMKAPAPGYNIWAVVASAAPAILLQGIALIRLSSAAAEQWFLDHDLRPADTDT